jgi:malonyl-CoA O-methyltransferase
VNPLARLLAFARPAVVLPSRAAYELWAETYPASAHNPLMRTEQGVVELLLARVRARRALDVGTGSGRYLPLLAKTGASSVVGIDWSRAMLNRCRAEMPIECRADLTPDRSGVAQLVCGDACRLPFRTGTFDLVNASLMVGDVEDLAEWAREISRTLRAGGHLIYSDFHPSWARHGWQRTFRSGAGRTHTVQFVSHSIDAHVAAMELAGLQIAAIREPRMKDDADADQAVNAFRSRWGNPPVVVVFHATKKRGI